MDKDHFLRQIFKPENFSNDDLERVLSQFHRKEFAKGDYLVSEDKVANYYFFLESGFVRSYAIDLEGNDITTNFFTPSDIVIDWHSYFLKTPAKEYIQATTKCVAWKISFTDFMKLFSIEAFREVGRTHLVNNFFALKNHTISMITEQAKKRYMDLIDMKPDVINNVALKHVATYLGITDTSLSRIRKEILKDTK